MALLLKPWPEFDTAKDTRLGAAVKDVSQLFADGGWHRLDQPWVGEVAERYDLKLVTVKGIVHHAVRNGYLVKSRINGHTARKRYRLADRYLP